MKLTKSFFNIYKYDKDKYSLFYVLLFWCVVLEVVGLADNICLTDVLYFFVAVYFFFKFIRTKKKSSYRYFIFPVLFALIGLYGYTRFGMTKMFMSQLRFVFNCSVFACLMSYFINSDIRKREKLVNSYLYVCLICSTFLVFQFLSFYLLGINLKFDIGEFNAASSEVYSATAQYRTGGFFNEPSWFALFMGPSLDIAYRQNKWNELVVFITGLILSTSNMGFLFISFFMFSKIRGTKLKYVVGGVLLILITFIAFPYAFNRLFEALTFDGEVSDSNNARVVEPLIESFLENAISPLGINTDMIYYVNEDIFLNTFVFVLLSFGILGLFLFLKLLLQKKCFVISLILFSAVLIEGCYGRIDFWMTVLAASVFSSVYNDKICFNRITKMYYV